MLMAILQQFIKALFMITPTQQIVCSIVSRQLITDQSPTSCRPIATYFQSVGNQLPTSCRPIADWSPIFRDSCRRPVADWSATEKRSFWSHSGCIGCSCFLVARQSPTGCSACVTAIHHSADPFHDGTWKIWYHTRVSHNLLNSLTLTPLSLIVIRKCP